MSDKLTPSEESVLYVLGWLQLLEEQGIIEGPIHRLTPKGHESFKKLREQRLDVPDELISLVLTELNCPIEFHDEVIALVREQEMMVVN